MNTPSRTVVRFPGTGYSLAVERSTDSVRRLFARRWMAELDAPSDHPCPYTIRIRIDARFRWSPDLLERRKSLPRIRHRVSESQDLLGSLGGQVRINPGRTLSVVELHPAVLENPTLLEPLFEAALGHALALQGGCAVHGAALELDGRRPLILGTTGSGKSTLSAAALSCGGRVISDDFLLLGLNRRGHPHLRAMRRDVWLRRDSLEVLPPAMRERCQRHQQPLEDRWQLSREANPAGFLDRLQPDCLILLRRDLRYRHFAIRPINQAEGLAALLQATSALYFANPRFVTERRELMPLLLAYAERLPAVELRLGKGLLDQPCRLLQSMLETLPGS